jgi:hypothetical protein
MPSKPAATVDPARLAVYERLVATQPGLERKGAAIPYTSFNGNMSSYLDAAEGMAMRLSGHDRARFLDEHDAHLQEAYGIVQKEYVHVSESLLADTTALAPWFAASCEYVRGLKPKPTKRG